MKATSIFGHEKSFFDNCNDSDKKNFVLTNKTVPIKNSAEVLPYVNCRPANGDNTFYYDEKFPKEQIVIHYTAGFLKGDISVLTKHNNHVSVPFIIPRNGKILNMWSSALWSYHLGPGTVGGNTERSSRTIAIEVSNIGYLKKIGSNLVTIYNDNDVYCSLDDKNFYTKLDTPFRGQEYYATFTNNQYKSLAALLRYLTAEYNIPRVFLGEDKRYITGIEAEITNFKGIVSHVNYRQSGKWDFGPAFDWNRLMNEVDL